VQGPGIRNPCATFIKSGHGGWLGVLTIRSIPSPKALVAIAIERMKTQQALAMCEDLSELRAYLERCLLLRDLRPADRLGKVLTGRFPPQFTRHRDSRRR
jgi:hypothetical protein